MHKIYLYFTILILTISNISYASLDTQENTLQYGTTHQQDMYKISNPSLNDQLNNRLNIETKGFTGIGVINHSKDLT